MTAEEMYEEQIPESELLQGAPLPSTESVFSMNWRMTDPAGCEVQITLRAGASREIIAEVTGLRRSLVDSAQKAGWTFPGSSKPAPSTGNGSTSTPPPVAGAAAPANGAAWVPPPPTGPVTQAVAGGGFASKPRESFVAVKMETARRAGTDKVDVLFYAAGHKYPDLRTTKTVPEILAVLGKTGAWDASHFYATATYDVQFIVEWTPGKPNSQGNPYKDLADIRPAA